LIAFTDSFFRSFVLEEFPPLLLLSQNQKNFPEVRPVLMHCSFKPVKFECNVCTLVRCFLVYCHSFLLGGLHVEIVRMQNPHSQLIQYYGRFLIRVPALSNFPIYVRQETLERNILYVRWLPHQFH
jgi:hypothetical protein